MISARDELLHLAESLTEQECERALSLLTHHLNRPGPSCPDCGENNLDLLEWQDDDTNVTCATCGFSWEPNRGHALAR